MATSKNSIANFFLSLAKPSPLRIYKLSMMIGVLLISSTMLYYSLWYIHEETYIWQCTTMADFIRPVSRKECKVGEMDIGRSSVSYRGSSHNQTVPLSYETSNKPNIAIMMIFNDANGAWDPHLMRKVIINREAYCRKHNYSMFVANQYLDHSKPPAWSKLSAARNYLLTNPKLDYIFYLDMDIVIMNMDIKLEQLISLGIQQSDHKKENVDFILTEDWNGLNTGTWFVRNTQWSAWLLQAAFNLSALFSVKQSPEGINFPFEYEQRAFHYLYNTAVWQKRLLPRYDDDLKKHSEQSGMYPVVPYLTADGAVQTSSSVREHFAFLPQCAMNSYVMYPFYWNGDREQSHYIDGDFLVHFAGKKGKVKTNLMNHYLELSRKYNIKSYQALDSDTSDHLRYRIRRRSK